MPALGVSLYSRCDAPGVDWRLLVLAMIAGKVKRGTLLCCVIIVAIIFCWFSTFKITSIGIFNTIGEGM